MCNGNAQLHFRCFLFFLLAVLPQECIEYTSAVFLRLSCICAFRLPGSLILLDSFGVQSIHNRMELHAPECTAVTLPGAGGQFHSTLPVKIYCASLVFI